MEAPREITVIQATAILISTTIGVNVLALPRLIVEYAGTGAPLVMVLGVLLAAGGVVLLVVIGRRFPNQNIIRYSEELVGKWPARLVSLLIVVSFMVATALTVRGFGEVVKTTVLQETPLEAIVLIMLFLAALPTRLDINTFAYIHLFYTPLLVLPGLFVFPLALREVEPIFLLPLWEADLAKTARGVMSAAAVFEAGFIMTLIIPAMRRPERAMTAGLLGMGISGVLYVIVVTVALAFFGQEELKLLNWPTLEVAKATDFPILERLDVAFLVGWLIVVFTTAYSTYYISVRAVSELFRLRDHRFLAPFLFPLIYMIAMVPRDVKQYYTMSESVGMSGLLLMTVYPLILLIVALLRRKGEAPA